MPARSLVARQRATAPTAVINRDLERGHVVVRACTGMFGCYRLGFLAFLLRIPERWASGWFDLVGQSHQVWHYCGSGSVARVCVGRRRRLAGR